MADNVNVTAGAGTTIAADEVVDATLGTVKVQFVKIMDGTLDGTTKAAVGASGLAVNAAGLPQAATGAANATTLTTSGTVYNIFGGSTPTNGFSVYNAAASADLIISDNTATPAINTTDSITIPPGAEYVTPPGYRPVGSVYAKAGMNSHPISARRW